MAFERAGAGSDATESHLIQALVATTIAAVVAAVPPGLSHLTLLCGMVGAR